MNSDPSNVKQGYYTTYPNDEIDLIELFAVLWRGRWLVIGLVFVSAILSFAVLKFHVDSFYRADVALDKPTNYQLKRLQPSVLSGGNIYQLEPVDIEMLYSRALAHANSLYVKRLYWNYSRSVEKMEAVAGAGIKESSKKNTSEPNIIDTNGFKNFTKSLSISALDAKNPDNTIRNISFESVDSFAAVQELSDYVLFIDKYTINQLVEQMRAGYETSITNLDRDYQSVLEEEKQKNEDSLVSLTESLGLAESLGIQETPYELVENVELKILDDRTYLLGSRVLKEEINALKARQQKTIASFVPKLRQMERWRDQLISDLEALDANAKEVNSFVVVSPAESSLDPVKPNKLMILIGVIFLSGMLGVIIVFIRHGMKSYQERGLQADS
ncbi:MAG: Wzz/FepE/Etk N-terminal domain-containing protein [Cellvibrionaceae bacterium]